MRTPQRARGAGTFRPGHEISGAGHKTYVGDPGGSAATAPRPKLKKKRGGSKKQVDRSLAQR
jgi:hypothetical protein